MDGWINTTEIPNTGLTSETNFSCKSFNSLVNASQFFMLFFGLYYVILFNFTNALICSYQLASTSSVFVWKVAIMG